MRGVLILARNVQAEFLCFFFLIFRLPQSESCLISLLRPRIHLFDLKLDVCLSGPDQNNNAIYLICFTFLAPREETWQAPPPSGHQALQASELSLPSPENRADLEILETVERLTKSRCYSLYDIDGCVDLLRLQSQSHGWSWQEVRLVPREMILRSRSAHNLLCPRLLDKPWHNHLFRPDWESLPESL